MMNRKLIVVDDFLPGDEAEAVRLSALKLKFETQQSGGVDYPGVNLDPLEQKQMMDWCCPAIAHLSGAKGITPKLSFFRLAVSDHKPAIYIHADGEFEAWWAAILYLTPDPACIGGTAFWRHKESGWTELPPEQASLSRKFIEDGKDEAKWEVNGLVAMKFNRLLIMRGNQFHSRYPEIYPAQNAEQGRLTWVCFYDHAA